MMRTYCARTSACVDLLHAALADGNVRRELILCHCKLTPCQIPEHENLIQTDRVSVLGRIESIKEVHHSRQRLLGMGEMRYQTNLKWT